MFNVFKLVSIVLLLVFTACASGEKKFATDYALESNVRIPVSVIAFKNKAARSENAKCHDWWWFSSSLGDSFQELAIDELMNYRRFTVLDRGNIQDVYDKEVNLINSSKSETKIEPGHFQKAKYTIAGVVDEFEYCAGRTGVGTEAANILSNTLLGAGFDQEKASVGVTLRLIDTKSGRVIASHKGKGSQTKSSVSGSMNMKEFKVGLGSYSQTSLSEAIQEAIENSINGLLKKANL